MSTPRRRLSLSENGTPTPQRANSVTESIESGNYNVMHKTFLRTDVKYYSCRTPI